MTFKTGQVIAAICLFVFFNSKVTCLSKHAFKNMCALTYFETY
jgi:hypothetical protein